MAESYKRTLRPWRLYLPTKTWFEYRSNITELDAYVKGRLRERWSKRQQGLRKGEHQDIADLLMSATEVSQHTSNRTVCCCALQSSPSSETNCLPRTTLAEDIRHSS